MLAACGDDGTEGLSACPDGKIVLDKMNILRCAPMANRAGSGATASAVTAQSTATKAATGGASTAAGASNGSGNSSSGASNGSGNASSGNSSSGASNGSGNSSSGGSQPSSGSKPAASSGGGSSAQIPKGPWACFQANDICSCTPDTTGTLGDMCKTHPTCCTYVVAPDNMIHSCLCVPADSAQCEGMRADTATYPPASKCPPS